MKRVLSWILAVIVVCSICGKTAYALESGVYASLTLRDYNARLGKGDSAGNIRISFDVKSTKMADSLGVSSIVIYTADDEYVTTITGSTRNGLIREDGSIHAGTYPCTLTSGISYYAEVTVFATIGDTSDQRVITTNTVTAPDL